METGSTRSFHGLWFHLETTVVMFLKDYKWLFEDRKRAVESAVILKLRTQSPESGGRKVEREKRKKTERQKQRRGNRRETTIRSR